MSRQPRVAKVLAALLVSMTVGAFILMALGNNPPSAGAFCLSSYYRLDSIEKTAFAGLVQPQARWNSIEVFYSGTSAGNIDQLTSLAGLADSQDLNCHFVICNGLRGDDGFIQTTDRWNSQCAAPSSYGGRNARQTIRICIVADGKSANPTEFQMKRTEALVDVLSRKFDIRTSAIHFPWH
jgi:hypothetical protein